MVDFLTSNMRPIVDGFAGAKLVKKGVRQRAAGSRMRQNKKRPFGDLFEKYLTAAYRLPPAASN
jgi:hypothetical protein